MKLSKIIKDFGLLGPGGSSDSDGEYKYDYNPETQQYTQLSGPGMKKGGKVSSASKRADGCAVRGKTKGRII